MNPSRLKKPNTNDRGKKSNPTVRFADKKYRAGPDGDGPPTQLARKKIDDDLNAWLKSKKLLKPDEQLELNEAELTEEITKVLSTVNENVLHNLVIYNFSAKGFTLLPSPSNTIELMSLEGKALNIDSEEGRRQIEEGDVGYPLPPPKYTLEYEDKRDEKRDRKKKMKKTEWQEDEGGEEEFDEGEEEEEAVEYVEMEVLGEVPIEEDEGEANEEEEEEEGADGDVALPSLPQPKKRKLINQFNFCERAALTYVYPRRNIDTTTVPPPRTDYGATVHQSWIYDAYNKDFALHKDKKEEKRHKPIKRRGARVNLGAELEAKYLFCWNVIDRMINQNAALDIALDYRFYDDPADEYRPEGTLLDLWTFSYDPTRKLTVTEIMFSPKHYDLFAVCYGTFDFLKQVKDGGICLFTVKNPSYPDYIIKTKIGVMCCDLHTKYPFLLAIGDHNHEEYKRRDLIASTYNKVQKFCRWWDFRVTTEELIGLYDGNVKIFNLKLANYTKPVFESKGIHNKHLSTIWQLRWGPDMMDGEINLYTVSSDGHVFNWILMQNTLTNSNIIRMFFANGTVPGPDGTEMKLTSAGHCMRFDPSNPEIFLIGTDEGLIYKCSTSNSSKYLFTYNAHYMAVYQIDFNRYNSKIFISCGADWRIKIWEDMRHEPLFIYDLGSSVGDVKWAPYSSTVFAAVTTMGKVFVYDLNVNRNTPACSQLLVPKRKNKLTTLAFNEKLPFLIVGDVNGTIISLKISPNLRIMVKPPKKQLYLTQQYLQTQKLEKLLTTVRELEGCAEAAAAAPPKP